MCGKRVRFPLRMEPRLSQAHGASPERPADGPPPRTTRSFPTDYTWPRNRYEIEKMHPYAFESFVAQLLVRDGCVNVQRVGGSGDDGIDVRGVTPGGLPVVAQCKRVSSKIPPRQLREFLGAAVEERDAGGLIIFVTSNYFSDNAANYGQSRKIILVNLRLLVAWLRKEWSPVVGR